MTSLSLCVIVKNEEAALPRMLRSAAPFVDEIIVCDTGSTDRSVAIALEFGAKVVSARFEDDFSAPRNISLAAATGDWVLVLDADEWLADGAGRAIRAAIDHRRIAGYYLHFENHLGGGRIHRCGLMRLFRNDASVRFEFAIHEQVLPRLIAYAKRRGMKTRASRRRGRPPRRLLGEERGREGEERTQPAPLRAAGAGVPRSRVLLVQVR
jgi:glycosyltransferase involved in cell wall biosynthesis